MYIIFRRSNLSLSSSLSDLVGSPIEITMDNVISIEELRAQMVSCFTCGVTWTDDHVSLDCGECGGYSLERPCPLCDGKCGALWKRDFTMVFFFSFLKIFYNSFSFFSLTLAVKPDGTEFVLYSQKPPSLYYHYPWMEVLHQIQYQPLQPLAQQQPAKFIWLKSCVPV